MQWKEPENQGQQGVSLVDHAIAKLGQIFRQQSDNDAGIDAHVEPVKRGHEETCLLIGLQIRARASFLEKKCHWLIAAATNRMLPPSCDRSAHLSSRRSHPTLFGHQLDSRRTHPGKLAQSPQGSSSGRCLKCHRPHSSRPSHL